MYGAVAVTAVVVEVNEAALKSEVKSARLLVAVVVIAVAVVVVAERRQHLLSSLRSLMVRSVGSGKNR